ncbi:MAG TPA: isochorismatase family cysteine hydrolase [Anaerolineaceae bacterium]|nr:isochorismatase family cysteine hydrolase [Anaerolineaceae bacterium]
MSENVLSSQSQPFIDYLEEWLAALPDLSLDQAVVNPDLTAIVSVDVVKGFCNFGPLASPRVAAIVAPIVTLFKAAWSAGMHQILFVHEDHEPDAVEFSAWPPHCVRGTAEAEPVDEISSLPFFSQMVDLPKNSISSALNTGLNDWLSGHPWVHTFIVTGDCTDLCTYQLAMHLRLDANARQLQRRVIVPADCVDTYDRSIETARLEGGLPHPAALTQALFLYHMALNGIEIVKCID